MQMLLFSWYIFFLSLFLVLYCMYFSFLSKRPKKCHIVLYECLCFNLFVVCQNEDLKHVAGTVTRKREEKKNLLRMIAYVFV